MKTIIFNLIVISCTVKVFSQTLKIYSGKFENGTANYQYYENENFERILNGNFTYKTETVTMKGSYKENKKNGMWIVTQTNPSHSVNSGFQATVTANYNLGKLNGSVFYKKTDSKSQKIIARSNAVFINNIIVKKFEYVATDNENNFTIVFNFDENGLIDGANTVKYKEGGKAFEHQMKYDHGLLMSEIYRNLSNGEIIKRVNRSRFSTEFKKNYNISSSSALVENIAFAKNDDEDLTYILSENTYKMKIESQADSLKFKKIPFITTFERLSLPYNSYWELFSATEFWINGDCQYCGSNSNPLYSFAKGAELINYKPVISFEIDKVKIKEFEYKPLAKGGNNYLIR